ncbi:MAG: hypothetical protein HQM12_05830 [SAR324 cluster bacterium]|nr:hypothetical protein [SAR324 cluster bacterium]
MKTSEKIALLLLPVGALFAAYSNGLFDSVAPSVSYTPSQENTASVEEIQQEVPGKVSSKEIQQEIARIQRLGWVRDPFTTPVEETRINQIIQQAFEEPLPELSLELIFFNGKEYVATISGQVLKKGDPIGIETLATIGEDYIILRSKRGKRTLFLNQPDISFSVEESRNDDEY